MVLPIENFARHATGRAARRGSRTTMNEAEIREELMNELHAARLVATMLKGQLRQARSSIPAARPRRVEPKAAAVRVLEERARRAAEAECIAQATAQAALVRETELRSQVEALQGELERARTLINGHELAVRFLRTQLEVARGIILGYQGKQ
jgi:hypothetical protein